MQILRKYGYYLIIVLVTVFASSSFNLCFNFNDDFEIVESGSEENSDKNEGGEKEKDNEEMLVDAHYNLKNPLFAVALTIYMFCNYPLLYPESSKPPPQFL